MTKETDSTPLTAAVIPVRNLREFFRESVDEALRSRDVRADDHTAHYLVNLLVMFARSERLYEQSPDGTALRPLAFMLGDALEARDDIERNRLLQRLGDVALFVAGFLSRSFPRRMVDIDYYIGMGGTAYSNLSHSLRGSSRPAVFRSVFAELAEKFQPFVDVLNDIAEPAYVHSDRDIMRLYEVWLRTGSARAAEKLRELGVTPVRSAAPLTRQ